MREKHRGNQGCKELIFLKGNTIDQLLTRIIFKKLKMIISILKKDLLLQILKT